MEKKLHQAPEGDELEQFVKNSFEGFEAPISDDMWDRIERKMEDEVPEKVAPISWTKRLFLHKWAIAASVMLLITAGLICENIQNRRKIEALQTKQREIISQKKAAVEGQPDIAPAPDSLAVKTELAPAMTANSSQTTTESKTFSTEDRASIHEGSSSNAQANRQSASTDKPTSIKGGRSSNARSNRRSAPVPPNRLAVPPTNGENQGGAAVNAAQNPLVEVKQPLIQENMPLLESVKADTLAAKQKRIDAVLAAIPMGEARVAPFLPRLTVQKMPVRLDRSGMDYWVAAGITPGILRENIQNSTMSGPSAQRPRFVQDRLKTFFNHEIWIKGGLMRQNGWGLETGIGYRHIENEVNHRAIFKLGQGVPHHQGGKAFDFNCDMGDYSGTAEVSLRVSQTDTTANLPAGTLVNLNMSIRRAVSILRVPVLVTKTVTSDRFQWHFKAGLVANFLLSNQVEFKALNSETADFKIEAQERKATVAKPANFRLGYMAAAGLEYRINKQFGIIAEPTISGEFAKKDAKNNRLPSHIATGVNLGVAYHF